MIYFNQRAISKKAMYCCLKWKQHVKASLLPVNSFSFSYFYQTKVFTGVFTTVFPASLIFPPPIWGREDEIRWERGWGVRNFFSWEMFVRSQCSLVNVLSPSDNLIRFEFNKIFQMLHCLFFVFNIIYVLKKKNLWSEAYTMLQLGGNRGRIHRILGWLWCHF